MRQTNGIMTSTCTTFAMGRIFRGATAGRVIVRTYIPDHPGSTAAIFDHKVPV